MAGEPVSKTSQKNTPKLSLFARFRRGLSEAWASVKNGFRRFFRFFFPLKEARTIPQSTSPSVSVKKPIDLPPAKPMDLPSTKPVNLPTKPVDSPSTKPVSAPRPLVLPTKKVVPPPPPLPWEISDEVFQQKCNNAVKEAVKKGLRGFNFVIPMQEQVQHQKIDGKLLLERNQALTTAKGNRDNELFQLADQKWRTLPTPQALQDRHIKAFNNAIAQFGQGYDFRINGLCLENIHDVRGNNNNCGANSLFHIILENLDTFNMNNPQDKMLLDALQAKLVSQQKIESKGLLAKMKGLVGQQDSKKPLKKIGYDAKSIKEYILDHYPDHGQQDELFGGVIRAHLGRTLIKDNSYYMSWVQTVLPQIDEGSEIVESPHFIAYISGNAQESDIRSLFKEYHELLGNEEHWIMLSVDEIAQYAKAMNFKLNTFAVREDGLYHPYANASNESDSIPKFTANIVNINENHWQYDLTPSHYPENKPTQRPRP